MSKYSYVFNAFSRKLVAKASKFWRFSTSVEILYFSASSTSKKWTWNAFQWMPKNYIRSSNCVRLSEHIYDVDNDDDNDVENTAPFHNDSLCFILQVSDVISPTMMQRNRLVASHQKVIGQHQDTHTILKFKMYEISFCRWLTSYKSRLVISVSRRRECVITWLRFSVFFTVVI